MGEIKVRQLDDWIVGVHRDMAQQEGQSLEQHLREILKESALAAQRSFARDAIRQLEAARSKYGILPSSVELIRRQREEM